MKFNIHAGHNPDGKIACGAVGMLKESTEARAVKDELVAILKSQGHTVYDCTVDDGASQSNVLTKIVNRCNAHAVDLDVSIHFNAGASDNKGDGKSAGTEVYTYGENSKANTYAKAVLDKISALGFRNRGLKYSKTLYVLRNTNSPAMLIECCFVDDKEDFKMYDVKKMAKAIAEGLTGKAVDEKEEKAEYRYFVHVRYKVKENAEKLIKQLEKEGLKPTLTKEKV